MIVRTVLSVLLAVALVAAATPAVEDARRERADAAVESEVTSLHQRAARLVSAEETVRGSGARRAITVRLPHRSPTNAGVDRLWIRPDGPDGPASVHWRYTGGTSRERRLPGLRIETIDGDPLTLTGSGRHRLVLALDGRPAAPVVVVRRFKTEEAAIGRHARTATRGTGRGRPRLSL